MADSVPGPLPRPPFHLSIALAYIHCRLIVYALAATTLLVHLSQVGGLSFVACAGLTAVATPLVVLWQLWNQRRWFQSAPEPQDRLATKIMAMVILMAILLSLVSHHPDSDDYFYLGNAVYARENPAAAMGFDIHFVYPGRGQPPFHTLLINTSGAYEYAAALVSYGSHLKLLTVYYNLFVAINASLLAAATFYLLTRFARLDTDAAAVGTITALGGLTLLAVTHRSPGSFAFTRFFQGKAVLLTVWMPLFAAVSIDFFRASTRKELWSHGGFLCALAVSGMGLSSTSMVFLPALATVLALAAAISGCVNGRKPICVVGYFATLSYLGLGIIYTYRYATSNLGMTSAANQDWPKTFAGHLDLWIHPQQPATLLVLLAASVLAISLLRGADRHFLLVWFAAATLLYLNPVVAPFLIRHVTSPTLYWRMFYLYPVVPAFGLIAALCYARLGAPESKVWRRIAVVLVLVALLSAQFIPGVPSAFQATDERLGWPMGYKLPPGMSACAQELIAMVPAGPMLAPPEIAGPVVVSSSRYPQYRVRDALPFWFGERGQAEEAVRRTAASDYAAGGQPAQRPAFEQLINSTSAGPDLRSVVLCNQALQAPGMLDLLDAVGFHARRQLNHDHGRFWVLWR